MTVGQTPLRVTPHARLHIVPSPIFLGPYLDLIRGPERDRHEPVRHPLSMDWAAESQPSSVSPPDGQNQIGDGLSVMQWVSLVADAGFESIDILLRDPEKVVLAGVKP